MSKVQPIKRHPAIQPLSRDHHQGLLLAFKLKKGLKNKIVPERLKQYLNWFFDRHLSPHFKSEEKYLFPILEKEDEDVIEALEHHQRLAAIRDQEEALPEEIDAFQNLLNTHIRFEERKLFNRIEKIADEKQLDQLKVHLREGDSCDSWGDEFWK